MALTDEEEEDEEASYLDVVCFRKTLYLGPDLLQHNKCFLIGIHSLGWSQLSVTSRQYSNPCTGFVPNLYGHLPKLSLLPVSFIV